MQAPVLQVVRKFTKVVKRNFGVTAPVSQNDIIQQLFIEKIREYGKKSKDGKLVEPSPNIMKELDDSLKRLNNQFQMKGEGMEFPKFQFPDPKYDSINLEQYSEGQK